MADILLLEHLAWKRATAGAGPSQGRAKYAQTINTAAGRITVLFDPETESDEEAVAAKRREMLTAMAYAWQTVPVLKRWMAAVQNQRAVASEKAKAEAALVDVNAKLPTVATDPDAFRAAYTEKQRYEILIPMLAERAAALTREIGAGRAAAERALAKVAREAIREEAVDQEAAFGSLVAAVQSAAVALRPEPRELWRELVPESRAAAEIAALLPTEPCGDSSPPAAGPDPVELPPADPRTGAMPTGPRDRSTVTKHKWYRGPGEVIIPGERRPEERETIVGVAYRPGA